MKDFSKNSQDSPLEFPCNFPLKVMGEASGPFKEKMISIVKKHVTNFCDKDIQERKSSSNKYLSLTLTVYVTSREQLDSIYKELHATGLVLMAL